MEEAWGRSTDVNFARLPARCLRSFPVPLPSQEEKHWEMQGSERSSTQER